MTTVGKLAIHYFHATEDKSSTDYRPGCGRVTGHGESCCTGHLCDTCEKIHALYDEIERLKGVRNG